MFRIHLTFTNTY